MIADLAYKDINQVMKYIRVQIMDSMQWCIDNIPECNNPKELFYYLKENTTFIDDPKGIELLQTARTLFENNFHGVTGGGDCDCLTIFATSAMIAQGWGNIDIILAGRSRVAPVHIYNTIKFQGQTYAFDLTEPGFNMQRPYPLKQNLPITFYKN